MSILQEKNDELLSALDNLVNGFSGWDFCTKTGMTADEMTEVCGFQQIALEDEDLISFDDFQAKIYKSLKSETNESKSNFDWEVLADLYQDACDKYTAYFDITNQIEDTFELEENRTVGDIEIHHADDLKIALIDYLVANNMAFVIKVDGDDCYMLSSDLESKLSAHS